MPNRSPCERYLKYLITHPDKFTTEYIKKLVKSQSLDYIGNSYTEQLRMACLPPVPFYPEDSTHKPSTRFLIKEEIESIYRPDDAMRSANRLLITPQAKELIETMLITSAAPAWICHALKRRSINAVPLAIERFAHYFFDTKMVDADQLRTLINIRSIREATTDPDEQNFNSQFAYAHRAGNRVAATTSPIASLGTLLSTMRLGIMPSQIDISKLAIAARSASLVGAIESALAKKPEMARDYSLAAKMLTEIIEQIGNVDDDLQQGLSRLLLATDDRPIPNLKQLSGGEHTLDLQPISDEEIKKNAN